MKKLDIVQSYQAICWDAHVCPPFNIGSDLSFLKRYKNSGVDFVSLNVGFDLTTQEESIQLIHYFKDWVLANNDQYVIIENTKQILECKLSQKLAIAFDIEGADLLNGDIDMVAQFYNLGVRQILFAYNLNNSSGGGCLDIDRGITDYGKLLVTTCNQIGMVIDCSHVGFQTSMDIINLSDHPIIFSHSNPWSLVKHPRNIKDEQIIACARKGGVIGITGIGIFLGNNDTSTEKIVEHIDYVVQLVGSEHVGIGLDCVFNPQEINNFIMNNPIMFPSTEGFNDVRLAEPEQFSEIAGSLASKGYSQKDIENILGENFLRVASEVWN